MSERTKIQCWRILLFIGFVGFWEISTRIHWFRTVIPFLDPFFISRPSEIVQRFFFLMSDQVQVTLLDRTLVTLQNTFLGFLVGVSSGFVVGLLLGRNAMAAKIFEPYIIALNTLPRIALVPLVTMLFGLGWESKVIMAWL
ncbi:MAG: ABC transporter permease, partial [Nitrospinota bacterium]